MSVCLASPVHTVAVAVGILIHDARVLLALRSADRRAYPAMWALPGGHVEPGESEPEALRRELHEELGITVLDCEDAPTSRLHLTHDAPGTELHLSTWRVRTWSGQPRNTCPDEHDRLAWFSTDELEQLPWAHPEHQQMLSDMLSDPTLQAT
ncbi:(deoxy)nucleoside triphosphate pyrophosphohydrolase [Kineococcus sp. TBRC 1896]|uniref:8-oxo-dGTP diphosphatase n=1 Tax=Kineococcus mangrovi TaxID=1660183 RepID=A0ABV4IBK9_9ACTN